MAISISLASGFGNNDQSAQPRHSLPEESGHYCGEVNGSWNRQALRGCRFVTDMTIT